jgi:phosphonate transport system substrate-binding protein
MIPFLPLLFALTLQTPAAKKLESPPLSLTFGVYQSEKATVMYRSFTPVIEALTETMETKLQRPVDVKLFIFNNYDEGIEALVSGKIDFVRFGPASYILAKEKQPGVQLIAMETEGGDKRFKGAVFVRKDSPIRKLSDLKGKKFAFGDKNSTIGRYLIHAELVKAGITSSDLAGYQYLGRHDTVVRAVEVGDFDAGSAMLSTVEKSNAKDQFRIIATFDNVTKPWVARKGLERPTVEAIEHSLCAIQDPAILKDLKISGFVPTSEKEYEFVREGMKIAERFEAPPSGQ